MRRADNGAMVRFAVALAASLALAVPAFADGPIATADPGATPPASTDTPAPLPDHNGASMPVPASEVMGPCGPEKIGADGKPQKTAHGEIDAGVDSRGGHMVSGTVCKPVGDNGGYVEVSAGTASADNGGYERGGRGPTRRP
ncbi:MAG TPA: hypothetical protein VGL58_20555 [Caulobacteraceae bacterium]|jgi:hypothetical protein